MKSLIVALGMFAATLGLTGTASAGHGHYSGGYYGGHNHYHGGYPGGHYHGGYYGPRYYSAPAYYAPYGNPYRGYAPYGTSIYYANPGVSVGVRIR